MATARRMTPAERLLYQALDGDRALIERAVSDALTAGHRIEAQARLIERLLIYLGLERERVSHHEATQVTGLALDDLLDELATAAARGGEIVRRRLKQRSVRP